MFCPQCGRESDLDGDTRFCRFCGLALAETRDNLRGFTEVKREGYKFINISFVLVAVLFWIQYFGLIPWTSFFGGTLLLILIFGFIFGLWFMGNWVVDRPAKYVKTQNYDKEIAANATKQLAAKDIEPATEWKKNANKTAEMVERESITDQTTRDLSHKD